ncbi:BAG family molecular chaperone regulator 7 [Rutidosis leptorrhynchoides]|uniref:BAG family molecular chaperone regulator 7 n=1 Tax=Rutidosis leptorrhynchoides TaxID=125765 RepID=UPI003A99F922
MSLSKRIELYESYFSPICLRETSILAPKPFAFPSFVEDDLREFSSAIDLLNPSPFSPFDTITDLIQTEKSPSVYSYKRVVQLGKADLALQSLCDRVAALELSFDKLAKKKKAASVADRKYTLTAEIKGPVERKYEWIAEIKGAEKKKEVEKKKAALPERKYKWTAEIKDHNGVERKYKFETSSGDAGKCKKSEKKEKHKAEKKECATRVVEIEESSDDHGILVLRQAFAKRAGAIRNIRGKNKELSPEDAALMIQVTFRAYLIRRSKALRALRELAIAKAKLKELRALFNNFSYRRHISRDAEERQKFSEKVIVLLLTVDAIEGVDLMVRSAKKSMVNELEAMLDVVDPQPPGKSLSMRRRTFDMPDGAIQKEIAEGVAQVVQMLQDEEESSA